MPDFDFDYWKELFETDPERYEIEKRQAVEKAVDELTDDEEARKRYKAMMWRQDQKFRNIKDPIARYNAVVADFWENTHAPFQECLNDLVDVSGQVQQLTDTINDNNK